LIPIWKYKALVLNALEMANKSFFYGYAQILDMQCGSWHQATFSGESNFNAI
jgi:hypothetical protein